MGFPKVTSSPEVPYAKDAHTGAFRSVLEVKGVFVASSLFLGRFFLGKFRLGRKDLGSKVHIIK
jgi:hypothetical protein